MTTTGERLGEGTYEAQIVDRGGGPVIGALANMSYLRWTRVRDDISQAVVRVRAPKLGTSAARMLSQVRTVRHELVIYRNGARVWEGPITRLDFSPSGVEIEARDVFWYASRRALPEGLDYAYPNIGNAVDAVLGVLNDTFGEPGDPDGYNVAPYITAVRSNDEPNTAKVVPAFSRTSWQTIDEYAHTGGMDYVVLGRRIVVFDVHTRAFVMPDLSDYSFDGDLSVVEYGSECFTRTFRTSNDGKVAQSTAPPEWITYYGRVDSVVSDLDEGDGDPQQEDLDAMQTVTEKELLSNYPAPIRVQVPANSRLLPEALVTIDQLVPGAWSRVSAQRTVRQVTQWQKLNEVVVTHDGAGEQVQVTLDTAPATFVEPVV